MTKGAKIAVRVSAINEKVGGKRLWLAFTSYSFSCLMRRGYYLLRNSRALSKATSMWGQM